MTRLREIKAAAEAATPGEWTHWMVAEIHIADEPEDFIGEMLDPDDARFVALSRTAVPWLVERCEALERLWELGDRAAKEPIEVDISDYSDEFCVGFLAGQVNVFDALARLEES